MSMQRFNVFGRIIGVERSPAGWTPFILGADGKRRRAEFEVPEFIAESELCQYLADLFHEAATPSNCEVYRIK